MVFEKNPKAWIWLVSVVLLMGGYAYVAILDVKTPEGKWRCTSQWSNEKDGVSTPRTSEQQFFCTDNVMSVTGIITIGSAKWSEKKEGTCHASGDDLYGTWTAGQTTPLNEAARQFEQERLEGKSLASVAKEEGQEYRVRVTSRTETQFEGIDKNSRVVSCRRTKP